MVNPTSQRVYTTGITDVQQHGIYTLSAAFTFQAGEYIKFNVGAAEYNQFTVVIILNVAGRVVGMVVDGVSDVIALTADQVKPAPEFSSTFDTRYITGLGTVTDRMLILVDIETLIAGSDMGLMDDTAVQ